jgi:HK97 family phage prohead protease
MEFKADAAPDARTFEGITAVWDKDLGGDVIHRGAFKDTIAAWKKSKDALPLLNSHNQFDIFSGIGQLTEAKETKDGLWSKWEVIDGPEGDRVMSRLRPSKTTKRPIVGKMSIGFQPEEFDFEQPKGTDSFFDRVRHLRKIDWKESSLVLFPMAPDARIDASTVKMMMNDLRLFDAKSLDPEMEAGLRRLAARIGIILQKSKATGLLVPVPAGKAKDAPDLGQDSDEPDELDEDTDTDEELDESDPAADPAETDSDVDDTDEDTDETDETDTPDTPEPKSYDMQEALHTRLERLKLKTRTDALRNK